MAESAFHRPHRRAATTKPSLDEVYDLKGLNLVAPDQVMVQGETPFAINSRRYARNEGDTRVAIHTRHGSVPQTTPVGETENVKNEATAVQDRTFVGEQVVAIPMEFSSAGTLTKLEIELKRYISGNGYGVVEFRVDNSGFPGVKLAQGSIAPSLAAASAQDLPVFFMDAPNVTTGITYWVTIRVHPSGTGGFALTETEGDTMLTSEDGGQTWATQEASFRFKTYVSEAEKIIGFTRRNPQNKEYRTLFAMGTKLYSVADTLNAVPEEISSDIGAQATTVRFDQVDDKTIWVDGEGPARWWNGDDAPSVMAGVAGIPTNVLIYQNRAFFVPKDDPTRVNFSGLFAFESYRSVDYFYVPSPKSPDHIAAWCNFQDGMVIFTKKTKHIVFGTSLSTFTRKEAVGTKGAVSQESIAVDRNFIYFLADDNMVYRYNGSSDELISFKMEPEFQQMNKNSARFHLHRNQLKIYYTKKSDPTTWYTAVYDIEQEQWFRDTGRQVMGSLAWNHNDNELIEFSSQTGWMFRGDMTFSDCGKAIDFKYWTQYKPYVSGMSKDRIKKFRPVVRPAETPYYLMVGKDMDFQDRPQMTPWLVDSGGAKWGQFVWGDGTKYGRGRRLIDNTAPMSGRGKYTQYRFESNNIEAPVWLLGYQALIKSGRPR